MGVGMSEGTERGVGVGNDVAQSQVVTGSDNRISTTYHDTASWREFVRRDLEMLGRQTMIALVAIMVLFILGAMATGLAIRQFDLMHSRLDRTEERIRQVQPPVYQPWMPLP